MKNLKDLTPAEWDQYTTEQAEAIYKEFPECASGRMYMHFQHPNIESMFGIAWDGPEREKWIHDVDTKYENMKKEARVKLPKYDGFNTVEDLNKIKTPEDIKSFVITYDGEDDHLQCANVRINGVEVSFDYYDDLGFLKYWVDSPTAFQDLLSAIETSIAVWEDMKDEEE